uniref:Clip domain-containing protein n=1 Tax=Panagrellus redivivus TaxID=6233 RepID=A0A7E4VVJ8_PANRE
MHYRICAFVALSFSVITMAHGFWDGGQQPPNNNHGDYRNPFLGSIVQPIGIQSLSGGNHGPYGSSMPDNNFPSGVGVAEGSDGDSENGGGETPEGGIEMSELGSLSGGNSAIVCPSGNRVYVHPISGDLQQCSQQLGFYNQTTCPGGTVSGSSIIDSLPSPETSEYGSISSGSVSGGGEPTDPPLPFTTNSPFGGGDSDSEEEDDEDSATTTAVAMKTRRTRKPKTPRTRRPTTVTTTEATTTTTTPAPRMFNNFSPLAPRRGPRCRNPDDAALIDFGNRLRDCYYQQCPYSYRCEFNTDIRRYICCGKERDVFPPPGLPPLPEPKPLVPRPFRPRGPPPYQQFGDEHESNPLLPRSQLLEINDAKTDNTVSIDNSDDDCPLGLEHRGFLGSITFCDPTNLNLLCPVSHPYCSQSTTFGATVCCGRRPVHLWLLA